MLHAQDVRDRLADLVQGTSMLSEARDEEMMDMLGQALGLCLVVTALNPVLMLRMLAARLDSPQAPALQQLSAGHWAHVLVRPLLVAAPCAVLASTVVAARCAWAGCTVMHGAPRSLLRKCVLHVHADLSCRTACSSRRRRARSCWQYDVSTGSCWAWLHRIRSSAWAHCRPL